MIRTVTQLLSQHHPIGSDLDAAVKCWNQDENTHFKIKMVTPDKQPLLINFGDFGPGLSGDSSLFAGARPPCK